MQKKFLLLLVLSLLLGAGGLASGLKVQQALVICVFSLSILGTLFFWDLRLSFLFIGSGILFVIHSVDMEHFIQYASLDVILFLVGMMIVVASMKESGLFHWLVGVLLKRKNLNGLKLFLIISVLSAVLSGLLGEVASIVVMMAIILEICDSLTIRPIPLVISSVMATNVGSASTLFGNPIGIIIALRGNLTFGDFVTHALPLSAVILVITILLLTVWYRNYIKEISAKLKSERSKLHETQSISWDSEKQACTIIFCIMITLIALHRRLELLFDLEENSLLIIMPIIFAGFVIFRHRRSARRYVENEVEWASLLFFMFLFAQAGVLQSSGVAEFFAGKLIAGTGAHPHTLSGVVVFASGVLSGFLDNTVVVASSVPVIKNMHMIHIGLKPLWWCLLFGACLGGNLTVIGSTANIIAIGVLEKRCNLKINFLEWLKIGIIITSLTLIIAFIFISFLPFFK